MKITHVILIPVDRGSTSRGPPKIKLPNSLTGIGQKKRGREASSAFLLSKSRPCHEGRLGSFHPGPKRSRKHFALRASSARFSQRGIVLAAMDFLFRRLRGSENSASILPRFCSHHKS